MSVSTPVTRDLDKLNIPYRVFRHPGEVRSLEQAARERGQRPEQVVRSIVFRLAQEQFTMVLIAGPTQVSWPALRAYLGQSRLTTASQAEVLLVTGYQVGAVSPFGLPAPLPILIDKSVLQEEIISIGSGERNVTVILKTEDMLEALEGAEVGEFGVKGG